MAKKPLQKAAHKEGEREPGKTSQRNQRSKAKVGKAKKPSADSTARVSVKPQPSQEGPSPKDLRSKKRTTDTRGARTRGKAPKPKRAETLEEFRERAGEDLPQPKPAEEQVPTAAELAAKQPLRAKNPEVSAPSEVQKVKGQPVEVVALPGRVDPVELKPGKRDTLLKDRLRSEGKAEVADVPTRRPEGGDWEGS